LIEGISQDRPIFLCEGEHDADTAHELGYVATTPPEGAEKEWSADYSEALSGADVIVVSDNDPHGRGQRHAAKIAGILKDGVAGRVRLIMFPVKDLSDWVAAGHTREELDALIEVAPDYAADAADVAPKETGKYMIGKSALASNLGNVLLALEQEPPIMNAFAFDEMLRTEVLLRPLFKDDSNFKPRPITDADVSAVQSWLQWFGFRRIGKDAMHDAISKHARDHAFHPVRDYLNALHWDGDCELCHHGGMSLQGGR